jgi:hypothetical protein
VTTGVREVLTKVREFQEEMMAEMKTDQESLEANVGVTW